MAGINGSDVDYGYRPPDAFRPNDPWDNLQGWDRRVWETGPNKSDIDYQMPGFVGIIQDDDAQKQQEEQEQQQVAPEMMIKYYAPPDVAHPRPRGHHLKSSRTLMTRNVAAEEASEKMALQELIASPQWHVVRIRDKLEVLQGKGATGLPPDPFSFGPRVRGVLLVIDPKDVSSAQQYIKTLRGRNRAYTCVCMVEKSPASKDPVAIARMSSALLGCGADEVIAEGWLSYYVRGNVLAGYKASIAGVTGSVPTPFAGSVSYEASPGPYGGANVYGPSGYVALG